MGHLAEAHKRTVEPDIEAGVHTLKVQICARSFLILHIIELVYICAAGIFVGHIGRIGREGVVDIGVLMPVVTVVLPDAWYRDAVPALRLEVFLVEKLLEVVDTFAISELPVAVEKLESVGVFPVFHKFVHTL